MLIDWTKHLKDPELKVQFENKLINSKEVLDVLYKLLVERETALDRAELRADQFDNPNWSHKQAFNNGFRSAVNVCKILINLDQQKGTSNDR